MHEPGPEIAKWHANALFQHISPVVHTVDFAEGTVCNNLAPSQSRYLGNGTQTVRDLGKAKALGWRQYPRQFPCKLWCDVCHCRQHAEVSLRRAKFSTSPSAARLSVAQAHWCLYSPAHSRMPAVEVGVA